MAVARNDDRRSSHRKDLADHPADISLGGTGALFCRTSSIRPPRPRIDDRVRWRYSRRDDLAGEGQRSGPCANPWPSSWSPGSSPHRHGQKRWRAARRCCGLTSYPHVDDPRQRRRSNRAWVGKETTANIVATTTNHPSPGAPDASILRCNGPLCLTPVRAHQVTACQVNPTFGRRTALSSTR